MYHNVGVFDQDIFDGWHFYVVDFTLRAELQLLYKLPL